MQEIVQAIVWALLNSSWQSTLLWLAYKAFYSKGSASSKKQFLLLGIILQCLATLLFTFIPLFDKHPIFSLNIVATYFWEPFVFILYLALFSIRLMQTFRDNKSIITWRSGLSKPSPSLQLFTDQRAVLLGIKQKVNLWISDKNIIPHTHGLLKPIIILPASLILNLSPKETETIILHELAHIMHKDLLTNFFVLFAELVYYFNPFTLRLIRELRLQREICCDKTVLEFGYPVSAYTNALYLTAVNYIQKPSFALAAADESDLLKRIKIMAEEPKHHYRMTSGLILPILAVLMFTGVFIKHKSNPDSAQAGASQEVKIINRPASRYLELSKNVQTKSLALTKPKAPLASKKSTAKVVKTKPVENIAVTASPDAVYVHYDPGTVEKEVIIVETGSDGKTTKVIFLLKTINGKPQLIPIIQYIQSLPDSSRQVKDSIAEF